MSASEMPDWERRLRAPNVHRLVWSRHAPDRLVYLSNENGSWQAFAWDRATGTKRRVSDDPVGVIEASPTADGEGVVWFEDETGDESGGWTIEPFEGGDDRQLLPGAPAGWPDGLALGRGIAAGVLADRSGFAVYVSENGGPAKEIHRDVDRLRIGPEELEGFEQAGFSADERFLCISRAQDGDNIHCGLTVLDPRTGAVIAELDDGPGLGLVPAAWSPVEGDQRLAIVHERDDLQRPGIWDVATGERRDVALDLPGEVWVADWWPDASALLLAHMHDGRDELFRYDLGSETLTRIANPPGEVHGARVRPDGEVWFRASSSVHDSRILSASGEEVVAPDGERAPEGAPFRSWHFTNPKGDRVHGWVVTPPGEGPFPIFMRIHGGPNWLYLDAWFPEVQALVDHGYAVAMVNYRGSTGYGRSWRDFIIRNIGFPEEEDVVAGLDDLVASGVADPARAIVGGWSWGGYLTLLSVGLHPEKWVCGVAGVPVGDYADSYDASAPALQAYDRSLIGGVVHDLPDFVRERNALTYVGRVTAPLLALVGENDSRCPPRQAMTYVDTLRARGGDIELYTYGTGHSSFVVDEEVRQMRRVLRFVLKHVPTGATPPS